MYFIKTNYIYIFFFISKHLNFRFFKKKKKQRDIKNFFIKKKKSLLKII
jgi:hypothetical protein